MRVESVERQSASTVLTLVGGGRIAVPTERIANWAELQIVERADRDSAPPPEGRWREAAGDYAELIAAAAERHRIQPALLTALARVESSFDPRAVSPQGASGLLQLMPATAERFGVEDVFDVAQNVDGGARYLAWLLERYAGQTDLALAGYNAGEAAVDRYGGIPPYRETRSYVAQVLARADGLD